MPRNSLNTRAQRSAQVTAVCTPSQRGGSKTATPCALGKKSASNKATIHAPPPSRAPLRANPPNKFTSSTPCKIKKRQKNTAPAHSFYLFVSCVWVCVWQVGVFLGEKARARQSSTFAKLKKAEGHCSRPQFYLFVCFVCVW